MKPDIVLDTHVFADFLYQYFPIINGKENKFIESDYISRKIANKLNSILFEYINENSLSNGIVVVSVFCFIEISRKFSEISNGKFNIYQFKAFLEERPPWIEISPIENNKELFMKFFEIDKHVNTNGKKTGIEWADTIHCVTCLMRDYAELATHDRKLHLISNINFIK